MTLAGFTYRLTVAYFGSTIGALWKLSLIFCFYAFKSLMLFTVLRFPEEWVHGRATIKRPTVNFEPVVSRGTPGFESWRLNQLAKGPCWKVCCTRDGDRRWTLSSGQIWWWACDASLKTLLVAFFAFHIAKWHKYLGTTKYRCSFLVTYPVYLIYSLHALLKIEKIGCELYVVWRSNGILLRQYDIGRFYISSHRSPLRLKVTIGVMWKLAPFFCFYASKSLTSSQFCVFLKKGSTVRRE